MTCFLPRDLYGVIGWPLGQSLSPLIHNIGFQQLGIPAVYMAWPLPPQDLDGFVKGMRILNIRGCSVTIPHKIEVMRHLDSMSEAAALAGAVNTLALRDGMLLGENTDVAGFLDPLERLEPDKQDVLLLGAGGAAHAAAAGLRLRGCRQARVASPGDKRQYALAERFGFSPVKWSARYDQPATLVINATPAGMAGKNEAESPYDFARGPRVAEGYAYDLVYNPLRTRFLREAAACGRTCISGLEMFWGQAKAQFALWTRAELPGQARKALEKALEE